jgi:hypothetical protein
MAGAPREASGIAEAKSGASPLSLSPSRSRCRCRVSDGEVLCVMLTRGGGGAALPERIVLAVDRIEKHIKRLIEPDRETGLSPPLCLSSSARLTGHSRLGIPPGG